MKSKKRKNFRKNPILIILVVSFAILGLFLLLPVILVMPALGPAYIAELFGRNALSMMQTINPFSAGGPTLTNETILDDANVMPGTYYIVRYTNSGIPEGRDPLPSDGSLIYLESVRESGVKVYPETSTKMFDYLLQLVCEDRGMTVGIHDAAILENRKNGRPEFLPYDGTLIEISEKNARQYCLDQEIEQ